MVLLTTRRKSCLRQLFSLSSVTVAIIVITSATKEVSARQKKCKHSHYKDCTFSAIDTAFAREVEKNNKNQDK